MNKSTLYELAKLGMRERLKMIEAELTDAYREFPDVFLVQPPQLVRPELRNGHAATNGHGRAPRGSSEALLPYLREHGPMRSRDLSVALGLKSAGSLSRALQQRIANGLIWRVSKGLYAAVEHPAEKKLAGIAARIQKNRARKTGKPTTTKKKRQYGQSEKVKAQRARTARVLEIVAKDGPMPGATIADMAGVPTNIFGPLVRRGYLKNSKAGFTRTSKAFSITPSHA